MSDLKPIKSGKSQVLENRRREQEKERLRRRKENQLRRKKAVMMKRGIILAVLSILITVGTVLIVVNVKDLLTNSKNSQTPATKEEETTPQSVISDTMDVDLIQLDDDMYLYENDEEVLQTLKDRLYSSEKVDERLDFIIKNQAAYPPEMLDFLSKYEEVIDFVLKYPVRVNENHSNVVDISDVYKKGTIPTFIQWDDRWGYIPYGDGVIGDSGCGPTCVSMAVIALTGRTQYTPIALCKFAEENGYYVKGSGTAWNFMTDGIQRLGLASEQISISSESIRLALKEDKLVILSMKPGIFTYGGHFILVYKYEDGLFYVKDPNSRERTDKGFSYQEISDQIKGAWGVYLPEEE